MSMADKITQEYVTLDDITGGDTYPGMAESCQIRLLAGYPGISEGIPDAAVSHYQRNKTFGQIQWLQSERRLGETKQKRKDRYGRKEICFAGILHVRSAIFYHRNKQ